MPLFLNAPMVDVTPYHVTNVRIKADEIDSGRAEASLTRAKGRVSGEEDGSDSKRAEAALFRAVNRLRVSKR